MSIGPKNDVCPQVFGVVLLLAAVIAAIFGEVRVAILFLAASAIILTGEVNWKLLVDKWIDRTIHEETLRSQLNAAMREWNELGKK